MGRQTTEGGGHWLARCRLSLPSGLLSTQPSAQCGAGWGGRGSLSGDKWQTTLTGAVGQTPGGTWPRWLPQPRLLLGMGWLWGLRGREHPGAHALLWCRGQLGLERPWSMNTEPRGPGRGHGPGAELSAAPGQRLQGRILQLVGNPSGSGRTDPREQAEAWPWPCAQQLPRTAPGPWVAGQSGLPPLWEDRDHGWWRQAAPEACCLSWQLWPVSRQRQTGARSPARPPPPTVVLRDCPAHEEHLQGTGPPHGH